METNVNPTPQNVDTAQVSKPVADHGVRNFHYRPDELAEIEKKKDEHTKIDLGLQKYQSHY